MTFLGNLTCNTDNRWLEDESRCLIKTIIDNLSILNIVCGVTTVDMMKVAGNMSNKQISDYQIQQRQVLGQDLRVNMEHSVQWCILNM